MMDKISEHVIAGRIAAFFDFDGVLVDTEPLYDAYWNEAGIRYETGIPHFASHIKGTTLPYVLDKFFGDRTEEFRQMVARESIAFEQQMDFPEVPGALNFVRELKDAGVRVGLVTSSDWKKMSRAFRLLGIENLFDTVVHADRITKGKPDPMCYLLAAADFEMQPQQCVVFEDSFAGIESATRAGMCVIGLSTTNPVEKIEPLVHRVIPNFKGLGMKDFEAMIR